MRSLPSNRNANASLWLPLLLLFVELATAVTNAAAVVATMDTCKAQAACLKVEAIVSPTWKCSDSIGSCEYEACLMIKGPDNNNNCPESVSYICDKPVEMCNHPLYNKTGFPTKYNNEQFALKEINVSGQRYMCQMVGPNAMVEFLIKDGNGCSGSSSSSSENPVTIPTSFGTYATCEPRPAHVTSCTNDSPGQECLWRYYTPPCPAPVQDNDDDEEEEEEEELEQQQQQEEKRRELILAEDEPTPAPWSITAPAPGEFVDQNGCKVNIDIVEDPDTGLATTTTLTECETCDCP